MEHASGNEAVAAMQQAYAEVRGKAVHELSRALAYASECAKLKTPRAVKVNLGQKLLDQSQQGINKSKAVAAMKVSAKHKPKVIKFTGVVTVPVERERVPPSADTPRPPSGWSAVCYKEGPVPVGKPMGPLKTFRSNARRRRPLAGLSLAYKRAVLQELVPGEDELAPSVPEEDVEKMEAWLLHARESLAAQQQQQQNGEAGATAPGARSNEGPVQLKSKRIRDEEPAADKLAKTAARRKAAAALTKQVGGPLLSFQGDIHAPTEPAAGPSDAASEATWQEVPHNGSGAGPKVGTLSSAGTAEACRQAAIQPCFGVPGQGAQGAAGVGPG